MTKPSQNLLAYDYWTLTMTRPYWGHWRADRLRCRIRHDPPHYPAVMIVDQ
jgi:hypothetical protein